jgi:hypothetical protein
MVSLPTELTQKIGIIDQTARTGSKDYLQKFNALLKAVRELTTLQTFGHAPDVIIEDQKAQNTNGGSATSGAWRTRTLNTLVRNVDTLASLATNQITLPAGTYYIKWAAPAAQCNAHQTRLQNITDAATVSVGTSEFATTSVQSSSFGKCVVTITASKAFEIQHQVQVTSGTNGFGQAANFTTEVYARVEITRLA